MKLIQLCMLLLCFSLTANLQAQQEKTTKKVRIVKKMIDENGKETVEEIEVEGEEAERLLEEMEMEVQVEVDDEGNQKEVRIETHKRIEVEIEEEEEENAPIMIQLDGQSWEDFQKGDEFKKLPAEVQEKLRTVNINIEEDDKKEQQIIIKKIEGGEEEIIKWNGKEGEELPEDIQKMLDKEGINLEDHKGSNKKIRVMRMEKGHASNPARLGVQATAENDRTTIDKVMDDSAAAAAGLQDGDTIKKINGLAVKGADDLVRKIGKYEPGEHITIEYERKGKLKTTTAILKGNAGSEHKMMWTDDKGKTRTLKEEEVIIFKKD